MSRSREPCDDQKSKRTSLVRSARLSLSTVTVRSAKDVVFITLEDETYFGLLSRRPLNNLFPLVHISHRSPPPRF